MLQEDAIDTITAIWFYTDLALPDLGRALGLTTRDDDRENDWEWITGDLLGVPLDITRNHTLRVAETPTRIFRVGSPKAFTPIVIDLLVQRLTGAGIGPIMLGAWVYRSGNDFDQRLDRTIP